VIAGNVPSYNIILCDPAWKFRDSASAGNRGAAFRYPCLSFKELSGIRVAALAAKDCVLFLWTPSAMLPEALDLLKVWGFRFRTVAFNWVKTSKHSRPFIGMGSWTRSGSEMCLLAIRGKPKVISHSVRQVIVAPARGHSRKPDETRDRIVQLLGDLPRIELFAREVVPGWDCWGNEVPGHKRIDMILHGGKLPKKP
jgi:N6-adenosine-specific RNA methylase IME4